MMGCEITVTFQMQIVKQGRETEQSLQIHFTSSQYKENERFVLILIVFCGVYASINSTVKKD